ncbi:MAG: hypothetical protein R3F65_13985 [bacterium]|nr:hypothetical protein [Myxococcales bacterium]MCB9553949.1 hypothetical protein [Myxococcales bacterium]
MRDDPETRPQAAWLLAIATLLLVSPLRALWARPDAPWWAPFVPWALLVTAGLALARRERPR